MHEKKEGIANPSYMRVIITRQGSRDDYYENKSSNCIAYEPVRSSQLAKHAFPDKARPSRDYVFPYIMKCYHKHGLSVLFLVRSEGWRVA